MSRPFWPISEPGQTDYEILREAVLSGQSLQTVAAARFARQGIVGLITQPSTETSFTSFVIGAERPAWTPYADPRVDALTAGYELILETVLKENVYWEAQR